MILRNKGFTPRETRHSVSLWRHLSGKMAPMWLETTNAVKDVFIFTSCSLTCHHRPRYITWWFLLRRKAASRFAVQRSTVPTASALAVMVSLRTEHYTSGVAPEQAECPCP